MQDIMYKGQIYNRGNCPCNYCRYCYIDNDYIYRCAKRRHKAINALNPDLDTSKILSDAEVFKCRSLYVDTTNK